MSKIIRDDISAKTERTAEVFPVSTKRLQRSVREVLMLKLI